MKESKIPMGWFIPLVGIVLVVGIFLGRLGWSVEKVSIPPIEVAPPEETGALVTATITMEEGELPTQQPVLTKSVPRVTPTAVISTRSSIRPSGVTIPAGGEFVPTEGWAWICTGDFALVRRDRTVVNLFDELEHTGLIVVFATNSKVTAFAPYGGYCEPFSPGTKEMIVASKISTMLTSSIQCQGGCSSVNIKELDQNGNVTRDYWKP